MDESVSEWYWKKAQRAKKEGRVLDYENYLDLYELNKDLEEEHNE